VARLEPAGRRQEILRGAARVLAERGVDPTRLTDVAAEVGVSIGLLQHYFHNREELLAQTFDLLLEADLETWDQLSAGEDDPTRRLGLLVRLCCDGRWALDDDDRAVTSFRVWLEHWAVAGRHEVLRGRSCSIYAAWSAAVRDIVDRGVEAGDFHPSSSVEDVVDRFVACADGLAVRVVLGHLDARRMHDLLVGLISAELGVTLR
jgi:AcrR family transcriptional regulator